MTDNQELLRALNAIQAELQLMNKSLSTLAARQAQPSQTGASYTPRPTRNSSSSSPSRGPSRAPSRGPSRSPSGGPSRGFKRPVEDGEKTGYGAEMAARFPKKRGSDRPTGKPPAKKGGGYPKKPR